MFFGAVGIGSSSIRTREVRESRSTSMFGEEATRQSFGSLLKLRLKRALGLMRALRRYGARYGDSAFNTQFGASPCLLNDTPGQARFGRLN